MLEVLEPPAAEAAARNRSPGALERIRAAVERYGAGNADASVAVAAVGEFFRAIAEATGNRVVPLTQEPLLRLLESALRIMIDRAPPARNRIQIAQRRIFAAIAGGEADTARSWMAKHIRDFRRGFEVAGLDLDMPVPPVAA
jgi:DNA-binding FadR family transcriptional regulator